MPKKPMLVLSVAFRAGVLFCGLLKKIGVVFSIFSYAYQKIQNGLKRMFLIKEKKLWFKRKISGKIRF